MRTWVPSSVDLRQAVRSVERIRTAFDDPDQQAFSFYSIQRTFLRFLEEAGVREEKVPGGRGEVVFYNLGKFSQLISDFETIHYHSRPRRSTSPLPTFFSTAPRLPMPKAARIARTPTRTPCAMLTVHQAKGMQWPVVFLPALLRNRFPSKRPGGPLRLAPDPARGDRRP